MPWDIILTDIKPTPAKDDKKSSKTLKMNYTLALKLKEAGYPQVNKTCEHGQLGIHDDCRDLTKFAYRPTLSELIEAVGSRKDNFTLISIPSLNKWGATLDGLASGFVSISGTTPEEAVGRLWLKIKLKES